MRAKCLFAKQINLHKGRLFRSALVRLFKKSVAANPLAHSDLRKVTPLKTPGLLYVTY